MDIFFCDECGARVTDLDLRAGKGMRRVNDTICPGCVDQGLAQAWIGRTAAPAQAVVAAVPAAGVIDLARDRARTEPDDPFVVDEPPAIPARPPVSETDAIPASTPRAARSQPAPASGDDLAAAGGGFGALMNGPLPSPPGLVDEPEEVLSRASDSDLELGGQAGKAALSDADSPFDYISPQDAANPGKSETAEVVAVPKAEQTPAKPAKSASGRQSAQKRSGTTTSKRAIPAKAPSTRRSARAGGNKKVMIFSLISCGVMVLIFFGLVLPNINQPSKRGGVIRTEPLKELGDVIREADRITADAVRSPDDLAKQLAGKEAIQRMRDEYDRFAKASNWTEDELAQQMKNLNFDDVQFRTKAISDRIFILKQQGGH
jgi:hypothetical protein